MNTQPRPEAGSIGLEPLLSIGDVARALSCSRRLVERMRSSGKFPRPDVQLGKMPRWKRSTLVGWIAEGGGS